MADCAFTTKFSRRTILAGSTAAATLSGIAFPAAARPARLPLAGPLTLPSPARGEGSAVPPRPTAPDPDAALLRRIALVDWLGEKYAATQARHRNRIEARYKHRQRWTEAGPTYPCLGYWPADPDGWRMFDRYADATRSVLAVPAHTPRGILAKFKLARQAARTGDRRVYMYEDIDDWLGYALADLEQLAGAATVALL